MPPITNAGWDSTFFDDQVNGAAEITFSISTPAAQASGLLAAHTIRIEATAPSTPKIEFDASKVNLQNIPSTKLARSATKSLPIVCLTDSAKIDLSVYLTPDSDVANAKWFVNGFPLPDSFITADFCPDLALVKTFDIVAQDAKTPSIKDELVVVFVSQLTKEAFDEWLKSESADVAWLKELPVPYDSLSANETDPEPAGCTPKLWESSHSINKYFHPGAVYEMRSQATPGGHGHQVTYDQLGHIIKQSALGAGSADKSHPPSFAHRSDDVLPFVWASQLDGNPVECWLGCLDLDAPLMHWGVHMDQYFTVRPVWANRTQVAGHCAP